MSSEFITVAKVHEIPEGQFISVEVGRKWVLVAHVEGGFYAVHDECTHEEYPLSDGVVKGCEIECIKHGACFDLRTGAVTAPPAFVPVKTYQVRVDGDDVQVAVS